MSGGPTSRTPSKPAAPGEATDSGNAAEASNAAESDVVREATEAAHPSPGPRPRSISTRKGDGGTTGLLFGGDRVEKDDLRVEAYGTIDEAVAALGLARAELGVRRGLGVLPAALEELATLVLDLQRQLFVAGAELAANPDAWDRLVDGSTRVSAATVERLDGLLADYEASVALPSEFIVPGETRTSAALELARTIVRRAERRAVGIERAGMLPGDQLVPYLNRLADLLWVMARAAEQAEAHEPVTARPPARPGGRRGERRRT